MWGCVKVLLDALKPPFTYFIDPLLNVHRVTPTTSLMVGWAGFHPLVWGLRHTGQAPLPLPPPDAGIAPWVGGLGQR